MNQLNLFSKLETKSAHENSGTDNINRIDIYRRVYKQISWQQLLLKIFVALKVPLVAAKHQFITGIKHYLKTRPFPWFRVALVLLFAYVFFKKDMRFNVNMGAPPAIISEDENNSAGSKLTMGSFTPSPNTTSKAVSGMVSLDNDNVAAYIKRFSKVASVEMEKFGIPASIKMGQAILASHAGKNNLATQVNNHFGVTCSDGANCQDFRIGQQTAMVRTYQSAWESWRDHSKILSGANYAHLKEYGKNYQQWAKGLENAGYGSGTNYAQQLIQVIETYKLHQLDN